MFQALLLRVSFSLVPTDIRYIGVGIGLDVSPLFSALILRSCSARLPACILHKIGVYVGSNSSAFRYNSFIAALRRSRERQLEKLDDKHAL